MSKPTAGGADTEISAEIVRGILERRLAPAAVEQLLAELPDAGKAQLLLRIAAVARRNAALVDVANRVSDTLSLDVLFVRLLEVVTESLDAERVSEALCPRLGHGFRRDAEEVAIGDGAFSDLGDDEAGDAGDDVRRRVDAGAVGTGEERSVVSPEAVGGKIGNADCDTGCGPRSFDSERANAGVGVRGDEILVVADENLGVSHIAFDGERIDGDGGGGLAVGDCGERGDDAGHAGHHERGNLPGALTVEVETLELGDAAEQRRQRGKFGVQPHYQCVLVAADRKSVV